MKKFVSVLLALAMTLALSVSALAAPAADGSITIDNAIEGQTYTIYELLYLESYNKDAGAYSYKATDAWKTFITSDAVEGKYMHTDDQGYVTWIADDSKAADFAILAQAYAKTNNIGNQGSKKADSTTVEFTGLNLGYYLVDSTLGSLCSLDTTNPTVIIKEKNQEPTNEKKVEEDSNNTLGKENDADIGQMVKFVSEVTLPAGSENVIFHDKMSAGLTLVKGEEGKIGVTVYSDAALKNIIPDGNWPQTVPGKDGCTFEVDLSTCVGDYDKVYVVYWAIVNENAVVGDKGNPNESWLSYGENNDITTVPSKTTTYTWKVDVLKYTLAGEDGKTETPLAGAQFVLYKVEDGKTLYVQIDANNKVTGWTEDKDAASVITTPDDGKFTIAGLDSDTYYLEEIVAPAGYNVLKAPVKVEIKKGSDGTTATVEYTYGDATSTGTVKVLNQTGTELPSTGGIGTTIFYVLGGALMVGAFVLLVVRKRMRAE